MLNSNYLKAQKAPTIVAYQPQINFFYPAQITKSFKSPVNQRLEESFVANKRNDPQLSQHNQSYLQPELDYRVEIEKRFQLSKINKAYQFPRIPCKDSKSNSLEGLVMIESYDLKEQNIINQANKTTHNRTKTTDAQAKKLTTEYYVNQPQQIQINLPLDSMRRQGHRVKTDGYQMDDIVSIMKTQPSQTRTSQRLKDTPSIKSNLLNLQIFNLHDFKVGTPLQTDRQSSLTKKSDSSRLRQTTTKALSKSPVIVQQQQPIYTNHLINHGLSSNRIQSGSNTERKAYLNLGAQYLNKLRVMNHRTTTLPDEFQEDTPLLTDLIQQYERIKIKQINLIKGIGSQGDFTQMPLLNRSKQLPTQNPHEIQHKRTQTYSIDKQLRTEPTELDQRMSQYKKSVRVLPLNNYLNQKESQHKTQMRIFNYQQ